MTRILCNADFDNSLTFPFLYSTISLKPTILYTNPTLSYNGQKIVFENEKDKVILRKKQLKTEQIR